MEQSFDPSLKLDSVQTIDKLSKINLAREMFVQTDGLSVFSSN